MFFSSPCLGRDEAAKLLLSRGASVDIAPHDLTPLHFAAGYGMIGVMKVLLEHHADVISTFHVFVSELYMLTC